MPPSAARIVVVASLSFRSEQRVDFPGGMYRPLGVQRIGKAYGLSLLAAVLGLPGVAAGMISSNTCQIQGSGCSQRLSYGIFVGIALAVTIQLVLAIHLQLGLRFWLCSTVLIGVAVALGFHALPILISGLVITPGVAAWASDPPNRRSSVYRHWVPRIVALLAVFGLLLAVAQLT